MILIIAEKPSLARNIVSGIGKMNRKDGYFENENYLVTWAFGHLFTLYDIEDYDNLPLNDISSNDGFTNSFDNLYIPAYDTDWNINDEFYRLPATQEKRVFDDEPIKYHDPDMYIDANRNSEDNDLWENNPNKTNVKFVDSHDDTSVECVIGLYKYMEYLSSNDLWLRIGDGYMIIGKDDDKQLKTKNLL